MNVSTQYVLGHDFEAWAFIKIQWFYFVLFSAEENNEEIVDLTKEESEKIRVEDCEAFQCQMVTFGRQAYNLLLSSQKWILS